jgi:hypothetical protein
VAQPVEFMPIFQEFDVHQGFTGMSMDAGGAENYQNVRVCHTPTAFLFAVQMPLYRTGQAALEVRTAGEPFDQL